jgi:hypothetical protein
MKIPRYYLALEKIYPSAFFILSISLFTFFLLVQLRNKIGLINK